MTRFRGSFPLSSPGRFLAVAGLAVLLCLVTLSGCTQPVTPAPGPVSTTPPPVTTTQAAAPTQAATTRATPIGQQTYLTYTNSQYGFSISYPSTWTKQENTASSVVTFTAPTSGAVGVIPATMRVSVDDLSANPMSLDQYRAAQLAKKKSLDKFNTVYDIPYKGNGYSGWRLGYTYDTGVIMRTFDTYAIRGTTAYTVSFTSRDDQFASYTVQSDTMFKSFQLI
ncbi:MAG TPA: PsbP-related protein [Methanomicrobiales archaeon]|jgi:hypothetical protein|nr:PsbP-related protein [Methanomicrobiales archaeon]